MVTHVDRMIRRFRSSVAFQNPIDPTLDPSRAPKIVPRVTAPEMRELYNVSSPSVSAPN